MHVSRCALSLQSSGPVQSLSGAGTESTAPLSPHPSRGDTGKGEGEGLGHVLLRERQVTPLACRHTLASPSPSHSTLPTLPLSLTLLLLPPPLPLSLPSPSLIPSPLSLTLPLPLPSPSLSSPPHPPHLPPSVFSRGVSMYRTHDLVDMVQRGIPEKYRLDIWMVYSGEVAGVLCTL